MTSLTLRDFAQRKNHRVDYVGALLLVAGISAMLLVTTLGGSPQGYPWLSPQIGAIGAAALVLLAGFVWWEGKMASEPIVPLRLFRLRVFSVSNAIGFVIGFAMFGAIIYLPFYLQIVRGVSPTTSGLLLLPLMAGLFAASIGSGQIISRIGRYKIFPILGTAILATGMIAFSTLGVTTPSVVTTLYMVVAGFGLGLVMQVLVLAVQNGVEYKDLGSATSLATFFRSLGGAFGTAIFGAILTARLTPNLSTALPRISPVQAAQMAAYAKRNHFPIPAHETQSGFLHGIANLITGSPAALRQLPAFLHKASESAYVKSIDTVFLFAVPVCLLAFALSWLLPEIRLRKTVQTSAAMVEGAEALVDGNDTSKGTGMPDERDEVLSGAGAPA